jgi:heat shock protein HtpX
MTKFYNNVKTVLFLGALTALILFIGHLMGGMEGMYIALIFAAVMNFVSFFFSDRIAVAMMRAKQVGPDHELHRIVQELAERANLPVPRVYISPTPAPNAFATGRSPKHSAVCATEGLMRMLNRNEIAGVMAHELAHIKHRDVLIQSVAVTIGAAISVLGYMMMFSGRREGGHPFAAILVLILGPIAAGLIQAAISRSREYNADTAGGEICGEPMYLASALEKIHNASRQIPMPVNPAFNSMFIIEPLNAVESFSQLFQTHPPLEKRLENLIGRRSTGRGR